MPFQQEAPQLLEFLDGVSEGVIAVAPSWRILYVNSEGERILGKPRRELLGQELWKALPEEELTSLAEACRRAMARREPVTQEGARLAARAVPSANGLTLFLKGVPEREQAEQALHEKKRCEERMTRLHALTTALSEANTLEHVARVTVEQGVETLRARTGGLWMLSADGKTAELLSMLTNLGEPTDGFERIPLDGPVPMPLGDAMRTGRPIWIGSRKEFAERYPRLQHLLSSKDEYALASLPLMIGRRCIGGVSYTFEDKQKLAEDERVFLMVIAHQCALSLERVRLFEVEQTLRAEAEAAAARMQALSNASRAFSEATLDTSQVLAAVARQVVKRFSDACLLYLVTPDGRSLVPAALHNVYPEAQALLEKAATESPNPVGEGFSGVVVSQGRTILVPKVDLEQLRAQVRPEYRPLMDHFPPRSLMGVPLRVRGKIIGVLLLSRFIPERPPFNLEDQSLAEEIAERAALSIEGACLYEAVQAGEATSRFLSEASALLASSLESEETLRNLFQLSVPRLADWCAVDVLGREGELQRVASHRAPGESQLEQGFPLDVESAWGSAQVLRTRQPRFVPELPGVLPDDTSPEAERLRARGRLGCRSFLCVPLISRGKVLGALTLVYAGSNRRHGEADLRLAEDLARRAAVSLDNGMLYREARDAIHARDAFLSIASHELNTPLTSLKLHAQVLLRDHDKLAQDSPASRAFDGKLQSLLRQVGRLEKLIRELLDISRITAGKLKVEPEDVELPELVGEVVARSAVDLGKAGCAVRVSAPRSAVCASDRMRLDQVVQNLLSNAMKYGQGKPIDIAVRETGDTVVLAVKDYGIGIAPHDQSRLFKSFERLSSDRHYGGFGLGLWIVKQILDALGGAIRVESQPGQGALFEVTLPRAG